MKSKCIWLLVNGTISRDDVFTGVSANGGGYRPAKNLSKIPKKLANEPSSQHTEDQLWYYESAVKAYEEVGFRGSMLDELSRLVAELRSKITGVP
jgi:hypothetical protein